MPDNSTSNDGWMSDVQRALALLIIGLLCLATFALVIRLAFKAPIDDVVDVAKIMLAALVNMGLIALGFFFGSSKSKENSDATQAALVDKLTPAPAAPPTAPVPPWWARLTDAEKTAISTAGATDPRVQAFVTASQNGAATQDDLAYLVTKSLLTQDRVAVISAP